MSNEDCIEVLSYLCQKLGIALHNAMQDVWYGEVCGEPTYIMVDPTYAIGLGSHKAHNILNVFDGITGYPSLVFSSRDASFYLKLFLATRSFKIGKLRSVMIGNPWYGEESVIHCGSVDEAKVAADLVFPRDESAKTRRMVLAALESEIVHGLRVERM